MLTISPFVVSFDHLGGQDRKREMGRGKRERKKWE